jgi:zinc transport system substrate-binding protein
MVSRSALTALLAAGSGMLAAGAAVGDEVPAVVASIKPIHSLVAGVMEGVGEPQLTIQGAGSEHSYALRPSQAQALARADVVFWIGEDLEAFLVKPLEALSDDAMVVALSEVEGLRLLATREGGTWQGHDAEADHGEHAHEEAHEHEEDEEEHGHGEIDMHVWLDPQNAAVMVGAIAAALSAADPGHAATYEANAAKVGADLARLDGELAETLAPIRGRPFVVFHDAYQYFEERYGLSALGSITVDPQRAPGAARLQEIRAKLAEQDAACVFAEPQFRPALVETVVEGTGAGTGVLDPLGADLAAGPGQYAELLRALSASLVECLGTPRSG